MSWEDRLAAHQAALRSAAPKPKPKPKAARPAPGDDWSKRALAFIRGLETDREFTIEDVDIALGDKPRKSNARGQVINAALASNLIWDTGNTVPSGRPEARGRRIRYWRKI